jgi:cation diffusion facilitator family transporter
MHDGGKKAIIAAFFANLGIAISKLVAWFFTGAASMLAEAIHSFADTGNQGLLMLGSKRARRAPDTEHPFGYGAARYFWAFIVALVLFSLGGVFAIYEGVTKLQHPHELESPVWAICVLLFAIVLESFSLRTAVRATRPNLRGRSYWRFIRHTKNPELPVVLLEDIGALFGLVFALSGVLLAHVTGNARWDAAGSLVIGVLLVIIAAILAVEMSSLLIGESADPDDIAAISQQIEASVAVRRLIHLRTMQQGPDEITVATKVEFDHSLDLAALAAAINDVEARIRDAVPSARLIFIEPDLYRGPSGLKAITTPASETESHD